MHDNDLCCWRKYHYGWVGERMPAVCLFVSLLDFPCAMLCLAMTLTSNTIMHTALGFHINLGYIDYPPPPPPPPPPLRFPSIPSELSSYAGSCIIFERRLSCKAAESSDQSDSCKASANSSPQPPRCFNLSPPGSSDLAVRRETSVTGH